MHFYSSIMNSTQASCLDQAFCHILWLHVAISKPRHSDRPLPLFGMEVFSHRKIDGAIPMVTRRHFETTVFRIITLRNGGVSNFFERLCHSEYIISTISE